MHVTPRPFKVLGIQQIAIGGSDNHDATDRTGTKQSPVGVPATIVHADQLSTSGIIAGVRSGRVFVDVAGLPDAGLDMQAFGNGGVAVMGGEISVQDSGAIMDVLVRGVPSGSRVALVAANVTFTEPKPAPPMPAHPGYIPMHFGARLDPGADSGYIRPEIRGADGKLLLLGNPIYVVRAPSPSTEGGIVP